MKNRTLRRRTLQMREIEDERGRPMEQILREAVEAGLSWDDIAIDLGVSRLTLRDWTRRLGGRVSVQRTISFHPDEAVAN